MPRTEETLITFSFHKFNFIDTINFLQSSLDGLVQNLRNNNKYGTTNVNIVRKYIKIHTIQILIKTLKPVYYKRSIRL